jgi:hypothetical protein
MLKQALTVADVEAAICDDRPEIIEDYPADDRGPACLILGWPALARPLLIVVGYACIHDVELDIVTLYEPSDSEWYNGYKVRRKK